MQEKTIWTILGIGAIIAFMVVIYNQVAQQNALIAQEESQIASMSQANTGIGGVIGSLLDIFGI